MHGNLTKTAGFLSICLLTACGSSSNSELADIGYQGKQDPYVLTEESKTIVANSAEAALSELASPKGGMPLFKRVNTVAGNIEEIMGEVSGYIFNEVGSETIPNIRQEDFCGEGYAQIEGNYQNFSFDATNFCMEIDSYELLISGGANFYVENDTHYEISYDQLSINSKDPSVGNISMNGDFTIDYLSENINVMIEADISINGVESSVDHKIRCNFENGYSCKFDSIFQVANGKIYKVENAIADSMGNSIDYNMDLYLPDFGKVSVETEGLTFCEDGAIESGQILLYDEEDHMIDITYEQCGVDPSVEFRVITYSEETPQGAI